MKRLLPLLLLSLACSSGTPATYAKGAYRPPARAPTFHPHEDAPHTFRPGRPSPVQPGPRSKPVPHTPQTRREDTIWAGDGPKSHGGTIMFLDVNVHVPEVATEEELGYAPVCKWAIDGVLSANNKELERELLDMYAEYRGCAVLRMWEYCMRVDWHETRAKWEISERLIEKVVSPFEKQCREKWRKLGGFVLRFDGVLRQWMHGTNGETRH